MNWVSKSIAIFFLFASSAYAGDYINGKKFDELEVSQHDAVSAPAVAPTNTARTYYDAGQQKLLLSTNGGAYAPIGSGSGNGTSQWINGAGTNIYYPYNVGIGTTAPIALLQVGTNVNVGLTVLSNGNVGIDITAPTYPLQVNGNASATFFIGNGSLLTGISASGGNSAWTDAGTSVYLTNGTAANVGIGTSTPAAALDVNGIIVGENHFSVPQGFKIGLNGATRSNYFSSPTSSSVNAVVGNTERVRIDSSGNVGIGTSTPATLLEVDGDISIYNSAANQTITISSSSGGLRKISSNENSSDLGVFYFSPAATNVGFTNKNFAYSSYNDKPMKWGSSGSNYGQVNFVSANNRVEFQNVGNASAMYFVNNTTFASSVGIGTTAPLGNFTIVGTGTTDAMIQLMTTHNTVNDKEGFIFGSVGAGYTYRKAAIFYKNTEGSANRGQFQFALDSSNSSSNVDSALDANTLFTINYLRQVGIGMSSPTAALDIRGTGVADTGFIIRASDSTPSDRMVLLNNGNIGLGTTAPVAKLSLLGADTMNTKTLLVADSLGNYKDAIQGNGNVGIGTTGPTQMLEVNGAMYSTGSGDSYFSGNMGIGTTAPATKVVIRGSSSAPAQALFLASGVGTTAGGSPLIAVAPGGSCFSCGPSDAGTWGCANATCPQTSF
jgi:hypothetical protein